MFDSAFSNAWIIDGSELYLAASINGVLRLWSVLSRDVPFLINTSIISGLEDLVNEIFIPS